MQGKNANDSNLLAMRFVSISRPEERKEIEMQVFDSHLKAMKVYSF